MSQHLLLPPLPSLPLLLFRFRPVPPGLAGPLVPIARPAVLVRQLRPSLRQWLVLLLLLVLVLLLLLLLLVLLLVLVLLLLLLPLSSAHAIVEVDCSRVS